MISKLNAAASRVSFFALVAALFIVSTGAAACKSTTSAAPTEGQQAQPAETKTSYQPNAAELDPPASAPSAPKVDGNRALKLAGDFVAIGPRGLGSEGHKKAVDYISAQLKAAGALIEYDQFEAQTAAGKFPVTNIIGKIQGKKDGVIALAGHYETNLPTSDDLKAATAMGKKFVGANDGGSTTGLMLEIANVLNKKKGSDGTIDGYSVWFVFTDAEEATVKWSDEDSVYGSKHLAQKWQQDGTTQKVKALLLLDMISDKDLDVLREQNSTPWLLDVIYRSAQRLGTQSYFFKQSNAVEDDHKPFAKVGIPVADIIDLDYGFQNVYHHTTEDTMDKLSAHSLQVVGDVVLETIRALNTH
jgi:Zn-dependent M28 family amino/carboxypeptidase